MERSCCFRPLWRDAALARDLNLVVFLKFVFFPLHTRRDFVLFFTRLASMSPWRSASCVSRDSACS